MSKNTAPDKRAPQPRSEAKQSRRWIELIKLMVILIAAIAVRNSFSVFFSSIENDFQLSRGATSAFFSAFMTLAAIFSILAGWALDRFGSKIVFIIMGLLTALGLWLTGQATSSWQLYFTYSLLLAAGTGGAFSLVMATVSRWFMQRRGLALGIALSGEGVGTLAVAPLATWLIASFGWRTAYPTIGIAAGVIMIGLALFLKREPGNNELAAAAQASAGPREKPQSVIQAPSFSLLEAAGTRSFWFLALAYLLYSLGFHLVLTHIVPHITDLGFTAARAAIIVSLMGASTIAGRLIIGWASDKTSRKMLAIGCLVFQMAGMLWLAWSNSLWMLYIFAAGFGFSFGGISTLMATLIGDTFGLANIGAMAGTLVVGFTLGAAIGPFLGGFIFDASGSYFVSFLIGAGGALAAALFLKLTRRETKAGARIPGE